MKDEKHQEGSPALQSATLLRKRARELAKSPPAPAVEDETFTCLEFTLNGSSFAIPIEQTREALRNTLPLTFVPGLPAPYRGIVNIRGEIVPVIDLAMLLGLQQSREELHVLIVLAEGEKVVAFACAGIRRIRNLPRNALQQHPAAQNSRVTQCSAGMGPHGLVLLDPKAMFSILETAVQKN